MAKLGWILSDNSAKNSVTLLSPKISAINLCRNQKDRESNSQLECPATLIIPLALPRCQPPSLVKTESWQILFYGKYWILTNTVLRQRLNLDKYCFMTKTESWQILFYDKDWILANTVSWQILSYDKVFLTRYWLVGLVKLEINYLNVCSCILRISNTLISNTSVIVLCGRKTKVA